MSKQSFAAHAGRIVGTTVRYARMIDWAEVAQIIIHGLQILIVLTLLAGQAARRAWDALVPASEALGRWYSARIVKSANTPQVLAKPAPVAIHPMAELATSLEMLTVKQLRSITGIRRKLAKRELIALALAC